MASRITAKSLEKQVDYINKHLPITLELDYSSYPAGYCLVSHEMLGCDGKVKTQPGLSKYSERMPPKEMVRFLEGIEMLCSYGKLPMLTLCSKSS